MEGWYEVVTAAFFIWIGVSNIHIFYDHLGRAWGNLLAVVAFLAIVSASLCIIVESIKRMAA